MSDTQVQKLKEKVRDLEDRIKSLEKGGTKRKKSSKKRSPSKYNIFMGKEIKRVKKENPSWEHKKVFKKAAANYSAQK